MKVICLSIYFLGFLLIGNVFSLDWNEEPALTDYDEYSIDPEEDLEEEPHYHVVHVDDTEEGGLIFDTEPKEDKSGKNGPESDLETANDEDKEPGVRIGDVDEPLPDPETFEVNILVHKIEKLLSDFKAQEDKILALEEANNKLIKKIDSIEQQVKTNSVILTGVRQSPNESSKTTLKKVLHIFNRIMKVRTSASDIAVALRAESNRASSCKPIVVRFTNFATKMRVLAAMNRLSHTDMTVSSDYSELIAKRRVELVPYLQHSRAQARRAFILYDRLVVDGVAYTLEELRAQKETNHREEMLIDPRMKWPTTTE